jgi:hypothetical protein
VSITDVRTDTRELTMPIRAEFDASPEHVLQLWADPAACSLTDLTSAPVPRGGGSLSRLSR